MIDNLTLGLFVMVFIALAITLVLVHRENRHFYHIAQREKFVPIDDNIQGVIFEPEPIGATTPNDHFAIERQYDFIRGKGRFGTQHNIDIDGDGE